MSHKMFNRNLKWPLAVVFVLRRTKKSVSVKYMS